ncbi:MAG: hypothetical protein MUE30_17735 [Spirosomaceae bacterium]|nr:hypothetical protein [Spirosomataceae bacterium]
MKNILTIVLWASGYLALGQETPATDRKNVLENLLRTRDALISEQGFFKVG